MLVLLLQGSVLRVREPHKAISIASEPHVAPIWRRFRVDFKIFQDILSDFMQEMQRFWVKTLGLDHVLPCLTLKTQLLWSDFSQVVAYLGLRFTNRARQV